MPKKWSSPDVFVFFSFEIRFKVENSKVCDLSRVTKNIYICSGVDEDDDDDANIFF